MLPVPRLAASTSLAPEPQEETAFQRVREKQNTKVGSSEFMQNPLYGCAPFVLSGHKLLKAPFALRDPHPPSVAGHTVGPLQICSACSDLMGNLGWMMTLLKAPRLPGTYNKGCVLALPAQEEDVGT